MSKITVDENNLAAIADTLRAKGAADGLLTFPGDFLTAISALSTGGATLGIKTGSVSFTESYSRLNVSHGCGKLPLAFS